MHIFVVEYDPVVADMHGMTSEEAGYFKIIDVFNCKLRRKIADVSASGFVIDTIWG